jgi:hypothetical protein
VFLHSATYSSESIYDNFLGYAANLDKGPKNCFCRNNFDSEIITEFVFPRSRSIGKIKRKLRKIMKHLTASSSTKHFKEYYD